MGQVFNLETKPQVTKLAPITFLSYIILPGFNSWPQHFNLASPSEDPGRQVMA